MEIHVRMETVGEKIKRKLRTEQLGDTNELLSETWSLRVVIKGNNMLRIEKEKRKKELVATGFEPRTSAQESSVTTTAPANYVFKIKSSFYIIHTVVS